MDKNVLLKLLEAEKRDIIHGSDNELKSTAIKRLNNEKSKYVDSMQMFDAGKYSGKKRDGYDTKMIQFTEDIPKTVRKTKSSDVKKSDTKPKDQKIRFVRDLGYLGIIFEDLPKLHTQKAKDNANSIFTDSEFDAILSKGKVDAWPKLKMKNIYINEKDLVTGKDKKRLVDAAYPKSKTLDRKNRRYIKHKTRHSIPYGYVNYTLTRSDKNPMVVKDGSEVKNYISMEPSHNDLVGSMKIGDDYAVLIKVNHIDSPILIKMSAEDHDFLYMTENA